MAIFLYYYIIIPVSIVALIISIIARAILKRKLAILTVIENLEKEERLQEEKEAEERRIQEEQEAERQRIMEERKAEREERRRQNEERIKELRANLEKIQQGRKE